MKTQITMLLTVALIVGGCASGGGSAPATDTPATVTTAAPKNDGCSLAEAILGGCRKTHEERLAEIYGPPRQTTYRSFESWATLPPASRNNSVEYVFNTLEQGLTYKTDAKGWTVSTHNGGVLEPASLGGSGPLQLPQGQRFDRRRMTNLGRQA